jgi:hypothetical protein
MPVIFSLFAWFVWDVVYCIYTQAEVRPLTKGELILAGSGAIFAVVALIFEHFDIRQKDREAAAVRETHLKEMGEIKERLAAASAKSDAKLDIVTILGVERVRGLQDVTQTTGEPISKTIESATQKIERLEAKVSRHDAIFWGALDRDDREHLTAVLSRLGPHSVQIVADTNTDCVELARDLKACFKEAAWSISSVPLTGTYQAASASGLSVVFKYGCEGIQRSLVEALSMAVHGQCSGLGSGPSGTPSPDVSITIGPKRLHYDD